MKSRRKKPTVKKVIKKTEPIKEEKTKIEFLVSPVSLYKMGHLIGDVAYISKELANKMIKEGHAKKL